ncbi:MAG TPA: hypothetical protein VK787_03085 [Puia sp.]|jgi:D-alanine-D-alanine ligase|nr:hypothetical protein [Puia sp.]
MHSEPGGISQKIGALLNKIILLKNEITIIVVANVKGITITDDYNKHSVITDFFSVSEFEEIVTGFREFGFYVQTYTDETDFFKTVINREFQKIPGKRKLIYNTSQKGIGGGRQSLMPAFCQLYKIPLIGSNAHVSSLCRHKYHFNSLLSKYHSHLPDAWLFDQKKGWLQNDHPPIGTKVIVKPVFEAASIGIGNESVFLYSVDKDSFLQKHSYMFKQPLIVEEFIEGYEVEVPLLITDSYYSLGPIGIELGNEKYLGDKILGYDEIYDDKYFFYDFDEIDRELSNAILSCTNLSAEILEIEDFGRIDFRINKEGEFFLTDITTGPHTVRHSAYHFAFKKMGFSHSESLATLTAITANRLQWI